MDFLKFTKTNTSQTSKIINNGLQNLLGSINIYSRSPNLFSNAQNIKNNFAEIDFFVPNMCFPKILVKKRTFKTIALVCFFFYITILIQMRATQSNSFYRFLFIYKEDGYIIGLINGPRHVCVPRMFLYVP